MKIWYWPTRRLFVEAHRDAHGSRPFGLLFTVNFERKVQPFARLRVTPWVSTQCRRYSI